LQGKHYFSVAVGAILATGSVAMLTHGPRAAVGQEQRQRAQWDQTAEKPHAPALAAETPQPNQH
jgi:hypothetical protein